MPALSIRLTDRFGDSQIESYLRIHLEKKDLHDSYAMGIYRHLSGKLAEETLLGHISRYILRICTVFTKYDCVLSAVVRETKFRRSPLPQFGLEIIITLRNKS